MGVSSVDRTVRIRSLAWFAAGVIATLASTIVVTEAWRADAAPGDDDATLVPITPCRLFDTRPAGVPSFGAGETRTLDAHGTNGGCTIPADAVALSMNVTAVGATAGDTFVTIWDDGAVRPDASSLNPAPGQPPAPNAVNAPLSSAGRFNVFNFSGTVDLFFDVNGYYTQSSLRELASRLTAVESSVAAIDAREPFAVTTRTDVFAPDGTVREVAVVDLTAPAAGKVIVTSTATGGDPDEGNNIACSLTTRSDPPGFDIDYGQLWGSGGFGDGAHATLAGSRVYDVAAGSTATYVLNCRRNGDPSLTVLTDIVLTAVFVPAA